MSAKQEYKNKMIVVCSAVGGAGKTTVTVNLAALLAQNKINTVLMDGDLQFGDMSLALDLKPSWTLKDLIERNDIENVVGYYGYHSSGIRLLSAPERPEHADLIQPDAFMSVARSVLADNRTLLIDTPYGLNELNLSLMEEADEVLIVSTPGMAAVKNTKLMVETLEKLGLKEKCRLLINKATSSSVLDIKDIPGLMDVKSVVLLPEEKHLPYTFDIGNPFVFSHPKLPFSKEMKKVGEQLGLLIDSIQITSPINDFLKKVNRKASKVKSRRNNNEFINQASIEGSAGSKSG
ncbi:AAA family ATPase [Virgibacillus senegalensis]|uniref:AAA family ATPase n=1 Tax=Virgibacillus senegalensis TaxID=1499679 RepID=UPI00069EA4E7|nr:P-loop NTPase [Virgibacillus senegalensis]